MASEPRFVQIIRNLPFVCERCSRRFPRMPKDHKCPDCKVRRIWDQTDLYQPP